MSDGDPPLDHDLRGALMACARALYSVSLCNMGYTRSINDWMSNPRIGDLVFETSSMRSTPDPESIGYLRVSSRDDQGDFTDIIVIGTGVTRRWRNAEFMRIPKNLDEKREMANHPDPRESPR